VVTGPNWVDFVEQEVVERFAFAKVSGVVCGGMERQDSVYAGLRALHPPPDVVAIHDGARPFVTIDRITAVVAAGTEHGAAILAVCPRDTVKTDAAGFVGKTLNRQTLWNVQTPQVFRYELAVRAHEQARQDGVYDTDDAALVERLGQRVKVVEGNSENIKVTIPADLRFAEYLLNGSSDAYRLRI
jgi:2-C-methyl-D-erythritol 4-phosphate cytidylyltransferase